MNLTTEQSKRLYRAFRRSDQRLDGRVWVAVRTTGIYCLPSCRARKPNRENVNFYFSGAEAERAGFRPCRKCRPEVHGGRQAIERARLRRWLAALAEDEIQCAQLARTNGLSPSQLYRLFRRHLGRGPRQARAEARLARACALLRAGKMNVTNVAFESGFASVSTFYRWFRRALGVTPVEFSRRACLAGGQVGPAQAAEMLDPIQ